MSSWETYTYPQKIFSCSKNHRLHLLSEQSYGKLQDSFAHEIHNSGIQAFVKLLHCTQDVWEHTHAHKFSSALHLNYNENNTWVQEERTHGYKQRSIHGCTNRQRQIDGWINCFRVRLVHMRDNQLTCTSKERVRVWHQESKMMGKIITSIVYERSVPNSRINQLVINCK